MAQQGDVVLYQTTDNGEITVDNGIVEMSGGLETAAYLSMFGGNEDDNGQPDNVHNWWGNIDETVPARQYHSETQNLLQALTSTTNNLERINRAAERDLAWFVEVKAASSVSVTSSMPGLNKIKITVNIEAIGEPTSFEFVENWSASV